MLIICYLKQLFVPNRFQYCIVKNSNTFRRIINPHPPRYLLKLDKRYGVARGACLSLVDCSFTLRWLWGITPEIHVKIFGSLLDSANIRGTFKIKIFLRLNCFVKLLQSYLKYAKALRFFICGGFTSKNSALHQHLNILSSMSI